MGSYGESNSINATVGGLVWVRRRNGSWWPGRIMGMDELSETCLVSPRSGTPVKLLGREDASVDWYNLEKSKRVKAFRCGEYDECIEKAKASAASSNKKAVKYARREDAILHALELESADIDKEPLNLCSGSDKSGSEHGGSAGELPVMSNFGHDNEDVTDDLSDSEDNSNSAPELSQSGISFEEPNHSGSLKVQSVQGRRRTPNDSEDDGTECVKRMRGLEDLGVGVVSKRKVQVQGTGTIETVKHVSASLNNSTTRNCLPNGTSVNGGKDYSSTMKRKRSQVANVHEFLKRKNRRRPLTKVLESTTVVSVPIICDQLPSSSSCPPCEIPNGKISRLDSDDSKKVSSLTTHHSDSTGSVKENETFGMPGIVGSDSSDKLFDVPFIGVIEEEKQTSGFSAILVTCSSDKPEVSALGHQACYGGQSEAVSLTNEAQHESSCTSSAAGYHIICIGAEKGSSKWQSKGKRNLRHTSKNRKQLSRNHVDMNHESSGCLAGIKNANGFTPGTDHKFDRSSMGASNASYNRGSQVKCKLVAEGQLHGFRDLSKHVKGTTAGAKLLSARSLAPQRSLPYCHSRFTANPPYHMDDIPRRNYCSDGSLYDVKLQVKSSYRPQHVPLVSLVSKLNGKAFIGHPLTVEVLDDGHTDKVLSDIGCDLEVGDICSVSKPNLITGRLPSKNLSRLSYGKSSKVKKSGLLNKKIRKLSSLTGLKQSEEERKPMVDKLKGPVIACIPLTVVFSRIHEAVSGQTRTVNYQRLIHE
ncbi:putative PWWP domain-containing protein [Lupinus albus]|uniref:Putative PWWP domain-containing protein n=1 Tax=Lupinus albus TaxID=3870 RepID=A0A6A4QR70_LUPAL|nr:putative PWWP domain-containing protein [Lupinus albus]